MSNMRRPALLVFLFGIFSCGSPVGVSWDGEPLLRTEGFEFQMTRISGRWEVAIPYSYTNHTGSKVLLVNCLGDVNPSLEMKRGEEWVTAWTPVSLLCLSSPIQIKQGAVYRDTLFVRAYPLDSNTHPQFAFEDIEGVYRLRWDNPYWERNSKARFLPLELRTSNEIFLKE